MNLTGEYHVRRKPKAGQQASDLLPYRPGRFVVQSVVVRDIVTPDALFIHDVTALGGRLYASGWGGSTYIYDVSAVASGPPPLLGTVASGSHSHATWVTSDGAILISSREINDGDVRLYDISDPGAPVLLSTVDQTSLGIESFSPHNTVLFDDQLLFVSWYQAGVVAIDISNPANPVLAGNYDTFPGPVLVEFNGNWGVYPLLGLDRVLLSDLDGGLFVVDATATLPVPVPSLGWPGRLLIALGLATLGASGSSRRTSRGRAGSGERSRPEWSSASPRREAMAFGYLAP